MLGEKLSLLLDGLRHSVHFPDLRRAESEQTTRLAVFLQGLVKVVWFVAMVMHYHAGRGGIYFDATHSGHRREGLFDVFQQTWVPLRSGQP